MYSEKTAASICVSQIEAAILVNNCSFDSFFLLILPTLYQRQLFLKTLPHRRALIRSPVVERTVDHVVILLFIVFKAGGAFIRTVLKESLMVFQFGLVMNGSRHRRLGMQKVHDLLYGLVVEVIGILARDNLTGSVHNDLRGVSAPGRQITVELSKDREPAAFSDAAGSHCFG